jgi:hypothetical protein
MGVERAVRPLKAAQITSNIPGDLRPLFGQDLLEECLQAVEGTDWTIGSKSCDSLGS